MAHSSVPPRPPRPTLRFRVVAWIVILFVRVARWRPRTTGLDNVPREGGAVITWNHHGHVDFVITVWDIYRQLGRPVRYVAMRELWSSRLFGWVPRFADAIPVSRASDGDRDRALADAVQALRDGHLVMVAPEGGIGDSFELRGFRTGAARMAALAGVPLVPSVSWGSHRLTTTGHGFSPREAWGIPVEVAFGEPLHPTPDDDPADVTLVLRERMGDMLHAAQAPVPGRRPGRGVVGAGPARRRGAGPRPRAFRHPPSWRRRRLIPRGLPCSHAPNPASLGPAGCTASPPGSPSPSSGCRAGATTSTAPSTSRRGAAP